MQIELRFPVELYEKLQRHLFPLQTGVQPEQIAFCYAGRSARGDGTLLTVREVLPVSAEFIEYQEFDGIELADSFKVQAVLRARASGLTLIEVHSHPHPVCDRNVAFSELDKRGQLLFQRYLSWKNPGRDWAALVFGRDSVAGAYWSANRTEPLPVGQIRVVGPRIIPSGGMSTDEREELARYHRQTMAYGVQSQRLLGQIRVGVVGLGGLGSGIVQQLAYLGVRNLVLVDGDVVEVTNLNRLLGVGEADLGAFKTVAISNHLTRISPKLNAITVSQDVRSVEALSALKHCEVLIGAVDNDGVRAVLAEFAAAYLMPYLDAASDVIPPRGKSVVEAGGRVFVWWPGSPCLYCAGELDLREVRRMLSSPSEATVDSRLGYGGEASLTAPSVVHVNSHVASSLVLEFHAMVVGHRDPIACLTYRSSRGIERPRQVTRRSGCPVCAGSLGLGDLANISRYSQDTASEPLEHGLRGSTELAAE